MASKIGITILILTLLLVIAANYITPYAILQPQRVKQSLNPKHFGLKFRPKKFVSKTDSTILDGYWIHAETDTPKCVLLLLHGIGSSKEGYLPSAQFLSKQGYDVILYDHRAHGESGGQYCTYGFYEKNDISSIVDSIKQENPHLKIGIWGSSLGGAIAIQALENDKRIDFGIIESTFTDLNQIVYDYQKRICKGVGLRYFCNRALKKAGEIAHFDPNKVKPIESIKNVQQPILLAHGDADVNISVEYGKKLFENAASTDKELIIVPNAGHFDLQGVGGENLMKRFLEFIEKHKSEK